nr:unnamed protein product [Digitaria exilis]
MGTTPGINKLAAEADCPTRGRHVCVARGLADNTGVVVAVNINLLLVGPRLPASEADGHHVSTALRGIPPRVQRASFRPLEFPRATATLLGGRAEKI